MELSQADTVVAFHRLEEETSENLDGIGALLVNIITGVSTDKTFQRALHEEAASRGLLTAEGELGCGVTTTCTTDENLTLVLRVEIDEVIAGHEASLHAFGTRETRFFITCEYTFDGAVLDIIRGKDSQLDGTADAIIGTQRRTLCGQPLTIDVGLDGILVEIKLHIDKFVAHHIHMTLQDDGLALFHALGGRLADDDIACLINFRVESVALTPVTEIVDHLLFALGRTRNFVNLRKFCKDNCWF